MADAGSFFGREFDQAQTRVGCLYPGGIARRHRNHRHPRRVAAAGVEQRAVARQTRRV